jgi:hypothetical protein
MYRKHLGKGEFICRRNVWKFYQWRIKTEFWAFFSDFSSWCLY